MANKGKRTGSKNAHQKAKYKAHPIIADRNKKRRIEKDKRLKEKAKNKNRHRCIWHYVKQIAKTEFIQKCTKCEKERNKRTKNKYVKK